MKPRKYSSQAIVLARRNYSEADRILILFTKDYGKLAVLAKGVRKPKSRKRGDLEIFSHVKFSASRTKGLDIVQETEIINSFPEIRKNLKKVSLAYYFMEVAGKTTREDEVNLELYKYLLQNLVDLRKQKSLKKMRQEFVFKVLVMLGFWPDGKEMPDPDGALENVIEREMTSKRVGEKMLL